MFALRVLVIVAVREEFAELHNPVVDIIPPPPLHFIMRGSSCSQLVLFIMKQTGVQSVGTRPGSDGPLACSTENVTWVSNHVKLSIDRAGQDSLEQGELVLPGNSWPGLTCTLLSAELLELMLVLVGLDVSPSLELTTR